jgi:hypothetical protein
MKREDQFVQIPLSVEHFLSYMFGKNSTHGLAGSSSKSDWTKLCKKLILHLEKYVEQNIYTDRIHLQRIKLQIDALRASLSVKVGPARDPLLFAAFCKLCLLLMGDLPDHWRKKVVNRPEYFRLNPRRSLLYVQSRQQKVNLILRECTRGQFSGKFTDDKSEQIQRNAWNMDNGEFLEWFQKSYLDIHLMLFGEEQPVLVRTPVMLL